MTVGEILGATLLTIHNIRFSVSLMEQMREAILQGDYPAFRAEKMQQMGYSCIDIGRDYALS